MATFRIATKSLHALRERILISGVEHASPEQIKAGGYQPEGVVIPRRPLRAPTQEELYRIIAPFDNPEAMRLCRIPKALGERALQAQTQHFASGQPGRASIEVVPGRPGPMTVDYAKPGTLSTTRNPAEGLVGLHIDAYPTATWSTGVNLGPGARYLAIVPRITPDLIPEPLRRTGNDEVRAARRVALRASVDVEHDLCYFVRLNAPDPGDEWYEGYSNFRSDLYMHDGSLEGLPQELPRDPGVFLTITPQLEIDHFAPVD